MTRKHKPPLLIEQAAAVWAVSAAIPHAENRTATTEVQRFSIHDFQILIELASASASSRRSKKISQSLLQQQDHTTAAYLQLVAS